MIFSFLYILCYIFFLLCVLLKSFHVRKRSLKWERTKYKTIILLWDFLFVISKNISFFFFHYFYFFRLLWKAAMRKARGKYNNKILHQHHHSETDFHFSVFGKNSNVSKCADGGKVVGKIVILENYFCCWREQIAFVCECGKHESKFEAWEMEKREREKERD